MNKYDNIKFQKEAVVTYIFNNDKVLLIEKKRGLGAGKINVPGGHIEKNETPYNAAIRETKEEVDLDVTNLKLKGYLYFKFTNGLTMKGIVYVTKDYTGVEKETDEAKPFWCNLNEIPYNNMWEDDIVWIPEVINGRFFRGYFEFDEDTMIKREIQFYESEVEFNS